MPVTAQPARRVVRLKPQEAQEKFLSTPADIAIGGGSAGGGKTWSLLFEPLRHHRTQGFTACIFRRTYPEITAPDGPWAESGKAYPLLGAKENQSRLEWRFPSGAIVKFSHLQHAKDVRKYLGAQICYLAFDQLETFEEDQFFYMLSRNRSTCGVRPYVRATANPEPGWLADFLAWWIGPDGFPIKEREGKIRWMVRLSNVIHWADSWADLHERFPNKVLPEGVYDPPEGDERAPAKSVTFIPFGLDDNPILKRSDPGYRANLEALPHIQKMRLLKGNWLVSSAQGEWPASYFEKVRVELVPVTHFLASVVACDPSKGRQDRFGDYCAYVWLRVDKTLTLWLDAWLGKWTSTELLEEGLAICRHVARLQGGSLPPIVFEINQFQELLAGDFNRLCLARGLFPQVYGIDNRTPKPVRIRRLGPFLAQGRLKVLSPGPGGDLLVQQLRDFGPADPTRHDDGPDAAEMAVRMAEFLLYGAGAVEGSAPQLLAGQPVNVHEYPVPPNYAGPLPPPPGMPPFNPSPGNGNGDPELSRQERMAQILGGSGLPLR